MKTNQNANQQPDENRDQEPSENSAKADFVDHWWEELTPAEREFACDLAEIVRGLRESGFTEMFTGAEKVKVRVRALFERLADAYDREVQDGEGGAETGDGGASIAPAPSPEKALRERIFRGGGPGRWRWN